MKIIFDAVLRYWLTIFSQSIEAVDKNNCPKSKIYYFDFKSKEDESNIS